MDDDDADYRVVDVLRRKRNVGIILTITSIMCFSFAIIWSVLAFSVYDFYNYPELIGSELDVPEIGSYSVSGMLNDSTPSIHYYFKQQNYKAGVTIEVSTIFNTTANKRVCISVAVDEDATKQNSTCNRKYYQEFDHRCSIDVLVYLVDIDRGDGEPFNEESYKQMIHHHLKSRKRHDLNKREVSINFTLDIDIKELPGKSSAEANLFILVNVVIFSLLIMTSIILCYSSLRKLRSFRKDRSH